MNKKVLIAQFHHETNSFCPINADETKYRNYRFDVGDEVISNQRGIGSEMGAFIDVFEKRPDITLIPAVALNAAPSGPVTSGVYDFVIEEIRRLIEKHSPLDGILLTLHGAMVADNHSDGEGDLLENIRKWVGYEIPVIASLDLHANVTEKMAENATALIPYECYPHTDTYETGYLSAKIMLDTLDGKCTPVMAYRHIPYLLPLFPSEIPEIKCIYDLTKIQTQHKDVLSARFAHGFFLSDIKGMGMSVMVITNGNKELANKYANELVSFINKNIPNLKRHFPSLDEVLEKAVCENDKPFVIADASDNPGAGGMSDTTHILREILKRGIQGAVLATIVDPTSVNICEKAGVGSSVSLSLGGWSNPTYSGGPLEITAYVKMISDGKYASREKLSYGEVINHGKTAVVEIEGNTVFITSIPRQPWDIEIFRSHGIRPEEQKIIITKSAVHYRASYGKITDRTEAVVLPGLATPVPDGMIFKNYF